MGRRTLAAETHTQECGATVPNMGSESFWRTLSMVKAVFARPST